METPRIDDFHQAVRPFLLLSQLFSLFPLVGLFRPTVQDIGFRWISLRTAYSFYFFITALITLGAHVYYSLTVGRMSMPEISGVVYYSLNLLGAIAFFTIAFRWKAIMTTWRSMEDAFLYPPYSEQRFWTLKRETILIGSTMLVLAFVEDALHVASVYNSNLQFYERCDNTTAFWALFYEREHPKYFHYIPPNLPVVLLIEITHKIFLYIWTFMDLFIVFVGLALARRYNQLYRHALSYKSRHVADPVWRKVRQDYGCISDLVVYMERIMSPIVILTTASDLFFIFYQMFNAFRFSASPLAEAYFKFSLGFLILRTLFMLLVSSSIHVESLKLLDVVRSVPMSCWSIDVQRLTNEIITGTHCLSGHGFFYLKRGIILAMAGTLITFELVMLKEAEEVDDKLAEFCDGTKLVY